MKRFVLVLLFVFVGGRAWASNCPSLPYNLTNGTTADASQVMGNFNALLACANGVTGLVGVRVFTSNTTYTCDTGTNKVLVEVMGGGGGAGGGAASSSGTGSFGAGGSSGGYYKGLVTTGFCGATVTVGGGGAGGVGSGSGGTGGTSSLILSGGVDIACTGGEGNYAPVAGGNGDQGDTPTGTCTSSGATTVLNIQGQGGGWALWNTTMGLSGKGGESPLGHGGTMHGEVSSLQQGGEAGTGYGSGGGGGLSYLMSSGGANQTGGAGAPGVVIVWEFM